MTPSSSLAKMDIREVHRWLETNDCSAAAYGPLPCGQDAPAEVVQFEDLGTLNFSPNA
jgi:hypothetical protein